MRFSVCALCKGPCYATPEPPNQIAQIMFVGFREHPVLNLAEQIKMAETFKTGTVLIKDGTLLPDGLQIESEPCALGWRLIKNLDGYGLGQKIHEAGWNFFCLAGEIEKTVFGFGEKDRVRRTVKRILTNLRLDNFNSLEIMYVEKKRFLGFPYATVCAHSRHIQENVFLLWAKDHYD
jgi:hypothetical protein